MPIDGRTVAAIQQAAQESGVDPAYMMSVAERESNFDPHAHASKTIYGIFQMTGAVRRQYGAGDSDDPYTQAMAFGRYTQDLRQDMARRLGRTPSYEETYLGHHFGPGRASAMLRNPDDTPVSEIFSPYELSLNPHIVRAGTAAQLTSSTVADIGRRMGRFGGQQQQGGDAPLPTSRRVADFTGFGESPELAGQAGPFQPRPPAGGQNSMQSLPTGAKAADFTGFGAAVPQT